MKSIYKSIALTILILGNPVEATDKLKPVGDPVTRSADLVFRENSGLNFQLNPKQDLQAGLNNADKSVATYKITAKSPMILGIRWTPGSGLLDKNNALILVVSGKNNTKNQLRLHISTYSHIKAKINDDNWCTTVRSEKELAGHINIHGEQSVIADTYRISLDAAAFIS
ncbi:hypothetical protein ORN12_04410 [Pantoea vagans]|uniref:hypothetical protein n=1 Tax=Pantoea vagans TaxID=470934 RepID=UPI002251A8A6|nr:hypothetical protein [Pantoea vagans]MCX3308251.1 hypothetical protein [Pantoea vagans]